MEIHSDNAQYLGTLVVDAFEDNVKISAQQLVIILQLGHLGVG